MARRVAFGLGILMMLVPFLPAQSSADSFNVYVGYADSLRPSGFFPTPWIGNSGVVSQSTTAVNGNLDSGAVRIDNTGADPITITNFAVTLNGGSGPTYSLWGALTIGAGQEGIFTQTDPFNNAQFDTSDSGFLPNGIAIDAGHPLGGCTNPGGLSAAQAALCVSNAPQISFNENGTPVSFLDTGNILDTFGYDFVCCSSDGNESINWNTIGSGVSRGGTPEPSSLLLLGSGLIGLGGAAWRRKRG